jgi:tetratricopeptide (TPR) repeat protein
MSKIVFGVCAVLLSARGLEAQHLDIEDARRLAMSRQHESAERALAELLNGDPDLLPARLLRAHNYSWWRRFKLAQREFRSILEQDPGHEEALVGLGYAYAWAGDTVPAREAFEQALRVNPANAEARTGMRVIDRRGAPPFEVDLWGGRTAVGSATGYGLRFLQASYQRGSRSVFARYDNALSLDNIDYVSRRDGVPAVWLGTTAAWHPQQATRLEYGLRFFPDGSGSQHLVKGEQVFFFAEKTSLRAGGFAGMAGSRPAEWHGYLGAAVPLGDAVSLEPLYHYSHGGGGNRGHRLLLAAKVYHPRGHELTAGGFYGRERIPGGGGVRQQVSGGFVVGVVPLTRTVAAQLAIAREAGVFETATVVAAGLKVRVGR